MNSIAVQIASLTEVDYSIVRTMEKILLILALPVYTKKDFYLQYMISYIARSFVK